MRTLPLLAASLLLAVVLAPAPAGAVVFTDPVPTTTLFHGYVGPGATNRAPAYLVITDQGTLDTFYALYVGASAPTVDFSEQTVLAAASGHRNADCGFAITSVARAPLASADAVEARVFGALVGSLLCFQVINTKVHVVAVPVLEGGVLFVDDVTNAPVGGGASA